MQPLRELAEPLLDLSGPWPWLGLQSAFDPFFPKGALLLLEVARAERAVARRRSTTIVRLAAERPTPRTDIGIWHQGGAMSRVGETRDGVRRARRSRSSSPSRRAGPTPPRRRGASPGPARPGPRWAALVTGGIYLNFPGFGEEKEELVRAAYGANYERLAELKAKYDPTNLFRMNLNITPAELTGGVRDA